MASDGTYTDKVEITWPSVSGASYYRVSRAISPKEIRIAMGFWQSGTSYNDISVMPGTTYYYWVMAATNNRGIGASENSAYDSGWRKLSAPSGVLASDGTYTDKVEITWSSVSGASYYRVWRATSLEGTKTALGSWQKGRSYNDISATPGMTYYYWVMAATSNRGDRGSDYSYDTGWQARSSGGLVRYVDVAAGGTNDGTSWTNAYNHLQDALAHVGAGDEIWVAEGTYRPDKSGGVTPADREASFELRNDVVIYGGFPSGGGDWEDRNADGHQTILSGDLIGNDGANFANNRDNSYHVVSGSFTDTTAILDGFTITAGNANGDGMPHDAGGGMRNESGNPTVRNCTFTANSAIWGGGIENFEASPVIVGCTFSGNFAGTGGGINNFNSNVSLTDCTFSGNSANRGGGMYNRDGSSPTITDCTFSGNTAGIQGGGMYNIANSNPTLISCTFGGNSAEAYGGGMLNSESSSPLLTDCTFSENSADDGGGMFNTEVSSPTVTGCTFSGNSAKFGGGMSNAANSNPTITDCIFAGNTVEYDTTEHGSGGGGMYNNSSSPRVTGCTFSGNRANSGGGMSNTTNSSPTITDCTFADNTVEYAGWLGSYGGGMFNGRNCSPIVSTCTFSGNSADGGGGMSNWNQSGVTVTGCTFMGNSSAKSGGGMVSYGCTLTVTNCTFSGNSSGNSGGGMSNGYCSPTVTGCTFTGNSAGRGGGMYSYSLTQNSSPIVSNCVLWGNTASSEGNEIYNQGTNITPIISYCDIAGCLGGGAWDTSLGTDGGGNIDADPLFVDADGADDTAGTEDDNLRLQSGSPWIIRELVWKLRLTLMGTRGLLMVIVMAARL